ncbi:glycosyltransferase family 28 C-terminal domain-containing protein [Nemania sp. FL0031]|nr:glycosyltransferase family 28 C-terminal domain-containing protein [Nemania sp. FL0031]
MSELDPDKSHDQLPRTAFVTIGATAGFRALLYEVISEKFLLTLKSHGFTNLIVQCGPDLEYFNSIRPYHALKSYGLEITAFSYAPDLRPYFNQAASSEENNNMRRAGVVISHAGSGSIIEALEFDGLLVAVPNPQLMDNHQVEIAEEMASQGYLIHGKLGFLADAVENVDSTVMSQWPPGPSPDSAYQNGGLWEAINELMPRPS